MATLAERMLSARESVCEVAEGKKIRLRRPPQTRIMQMRAGVTVDDVYSAAVGWSGFTEADLLGADVGSDSEATFSPDTFRVWAEDNAEALGKLAEHLMEQIVAFIERTKGDRKN